MPNKLVCGFTIHRHCRKSALFTTHCDGRDSGQQQASGGKKNVNSWREGVSSKEVMLQGGAIGQERRGSAFKDKEIENAKEEVLENAFDEKELGKIFDQFDEIDAKQSGAIDQKELGMKNIWICSLY